MDFFYLDDVFIVANHILNHGGPNDINLVYHKNKYDLITLSGLIYKHIGISTPTPVSLKIFNRGADYFGCGEVLYNLNLPLIGLEEGIKRTINNLL